MGFGSVIFEPVAAPFVSALFADALAAGAGLGLVAVAGFVALAAGFFGEDAVGVVACTFGDAVCGAGDADGCSVANEGGG